ncbi:PREDICTED: uncharacterized protein LOC104596010 isoform X2 [Nelumbo nucifera]|uniref:Uncharacterized protein LOC104596010 isoform X2 n=1 Tax=Nelumbo nucifera TaxID=4432 RepID=A0A1U7ZT73_NELNU|nr:PREDICTED: uncharacterized protein LOC104596010 isoform X2 [Nelumbo nucifera]
MNPIMGTALDLRLLVFTSCFLLSCSSYDEQGTNNSFTVSAFTYSDIRLKPYDWRYIRVDLPHWFASLSISLKSDVNFDKSMIPMICLRDGSPPLPDATNTSLKASDLFSNGSVGGLQNLSNVEHCHLLQKNMMVKLTNEQISPGVWYVGLFNGIGPVRTQSKMIIRGPTYSISANVSVEGCTTSTIWGPYCNQTVDPLRCDISGVYKQTKYLLDVNMHNQTVESFVGCRSSYESACHRDGEPKIYSLEVVGTAAQLTIMATNISFNETNAANKTENTSGIVLMCYARHDAIPLTSLHDYSSDISQAPLVINSPKVGRWFFSIQPIYQSEVHGKMQDVNVNADLCYSMEWQVIQCPIGKAGPNCTWQKYVLQTILRKNPSVPFESYYLPIDEKISLESANFPLEPLLSNFSFGDQLDNVWTYFLLDIPHGAAGGNMHVQLKSDIKLEYQIYARFGGLPSKDTWDYYYANRTSNSNASMFFKLYDSSEKGANFYILYVKEGTWSFGLRHGNPSKHQTTMSISIERCPKQCSSHGTCQNVVDASGLTLYSYCSCDRNHGGFDCSVEIVSREGHIWQSIALISSNAAALLPAFWALRKKEFAEWVLFTSSGISSGLYHACDVGTWCALSFHVLQFMDFWLSFMAVVSTFVYLAAIDEVSRRAIHTCVSILTALMAATGATRSANIIIVIAIGGLGLFIGWLVEFSTTHRSISWSTGFCLNIIDGWRGWVRNLIKTLFKRFHWVFVLLGFIALSMAAISWKLESSESYWIWHSLWHVTIYTSSFFFLCSKVMSVDTRNHERSDGDYALTRQDSFPRVG